MNKKTFISALILLYLNTGCSNNDIYRELSGNFVYRDEGGESKQILVSKGKQQNEIYGKVLSYDYNSEFIIVCQKPSLKDHINMIGFYLRDNLSKYPDNSKDELLKSQIEADSLIKHNPFYKAIFKNDINYWIIKLSNDSLIGPLTKNEYETTRKEMKIPEILKLNE